MASMTRQSTFGPRATLLIRFYVGVGFVVLGVLSIFANPSSAYPPSDQRSSPLFWIEMGGAVAVVGAVILLSALRALRRRREPQPADQPLAGDIYER
jgi:hypothetical protein